MDLFDANDVRSLSVLAVPPGARVLVLGGGGGPALTEALHDRGCDIWGVASDERTASAVRRQCSGILVADLDGIVLRHRFAAPAFDAVLAVGILHYVRSPLDLLQEAAALLAPSGRLVASFLNVAHGAVRLDLLRGRFMAPRYKDLAGEPFHVFDVASAQALLEKAGLSVGERLNVVRPLDQTETRLNLSSFSEEALSQVRADPESLVYELVLIASPTAPAGADSRRAEITLVEQLRARVEEVTEALTAARSQIERLEEITAVLNRQANDLASRAARGSEIQAELADASEEQQHLELDVAFKNAFIEKLKARVETLEHDLAAALRRSEADRQNANVAISETQIALTEVQESLARQAEQVARLRLRAAELDSLHHRVADKANLLFRHIPVMHGLLKDACARIASGRRD